MESAKLLDSIILKVEVGSTAHGTGDPGKEDQDEMAIAVEPWECIYGLDQIDTLIYRPGRGPEDPSGPGDLDLVVYPLKKAMSLLASANPSVLMLLYSNVLDSTYWGEVLRDNYDKIISQRIYKTHIGYAQSQIKRLQAGKFYASRAKIVEEYGYDTKFAMHALRLLLQCEELENNGTLQMPIPDPNGQLLRDVRKGKFVEADFYELFEIQLEKIETLEPKSQLRSEPDWKWVNSFIATVYKDWHIKQWGPVILTRRERYVAS